MTQSSDPMRDPGRGEGAYAPKTPLDHFNDFQAYVCDGNTSPATPRDAGRINRVLEFVRAIHAEDKKAVLNTLLIVLAMEAHYEGASLRDVAFGAVGMLSWHGAKEQNLGREGVLGAIDRVSDVHDSQRRTYIAGGVTLEQNADALLSEIEKQKREGKLDG